MYCCVNYYFRLLLDSKTIGPFAAACCSKNVYSNIFNNASLIFCILSNKINLFCSVLFISWAGSKRNMQNFSKYVLTITVGYSIIMEYCPGDRRKLKTEKGKFRDLLEGHTKAQHLYITIYSITVYYILPYTITNTLISKIISETLE